MTQDTKEKFLHYQAQTTDFSMAFEVASAKENYIYDTKGNAYLDFVAGVSACTLGHNPPEVVQAMKAQIDQYMHVMVYGEYIQKPNLELCELLAKNTPDNLETTYLTNSGTEAIEGALKLAKRYTGREELICAKGAYHGSTQGALSVMGNETMKQAYRPLLPNIQQINFNNLVDLEQITTKTAAVILETIQGAAGFITPKNNYLQKIKERCNSVGALLILDEIQSGFGRTGKLFGFQYYGISPDIVVMGKGMGGGMPIGAFMSSYEIMDKLKRNPMLGHITTFGGNPVVGAAALATLKTLVHSDIMSLVDSKAKLFKKLLVHPKIKSYRGEGLMIALELESKEYTLEVAKRCMDKGLIIFWLLFAGECLRITPPLTITEEEIKKGSAIILDVLDNF